MNIDLTGVGQKLKEKREEKGLSIAQVADKLCLRKSLIEAIEAGNWSPLPHEVYVRGFVKEYAALIQASVDIAPYLTEQEIVVPPPVVETAPIAHVQKRASGPRRFFGARYAVFIVLAAVLVVFAYDRMEREKKVVSKMEAATQVAQKATQAETPAPPVNSVNPVRPVAEVKGEGDQGALSAMSEPKRLMITCYERTWISVVIDDNEKKEFMMSPHEMVVVNAKEKFDLLIGNAGGREAPVERQRYGIHRQER